MKRSTYGSLRGNIVWPNFKSVFLSIYLLLSFCFITSICSANGSNFESALLTKSYPSTPKGVVEAFCNKDLNGFGLRSDTWRDIQQFTVWQDVPGWDIVILVTSFKIIDSNIIDNKATVRVKYNIIGEMEAADIGYKYNEKIRKEIVTYHLIIKNKDWKIERPIIPPHISGDYAVKFLERDISKSTDYSEINVNKKLINDIKRILDRFGN